MQHIGGGDSEGSSHDDETRRSWPPPRLMLAGVFWMISTGLDLFYSAHDHHDAEEGQGVDEVGEMIGAPGMGAGGPEGGGGDIPGESSIVGGSGAPAIVAGLGGGQHGGGPGVEGEGMQWVYIVTGVLAVALCFPPIMMRAAASVRVGVLDVNTLVSMSIVGALCLGDFAEAAAVAVLFALSEWIEGRTTAGVAEAVRELVALQPLAATLPDGSSILVEEVVVGQVVMVRPGDRMPIDGVVVSGASLVDQANLTGESRPVRKSVGGDVAVFAGTVNCGSGCLLVECSKLCEDSTVTKMVALVEQAHMQSSRTEQRVKLVARYYTPTLVVLSAVVATVPWAWGPEVGAAYTKLALFMLITACPCALVISTPVTYVCALTRGARMGILVKGGEHLESLAHMQVLAMDKTGTLTQGSFAITCFVLVRAHHLQGVARRDEAASMDEAASQAAKRGDLLRIVASVEQHSNHPIALAVRKCSEEVGVEVVGVSDFKNVEGEGVEGVVNGQFVAVGNAKMMRRLSQECLSPTAGKEGVGAGSSLDTVTGWEDVTHERVAASVWSSQGGTAAWVWVGGTADGRGERGILAVLCAIDARREEAERAVRELRELGVETVMLTGDSHASAMAVQKVVGVEQVHAELLPVDKVQVLRELRGGEGGDRGRVVGMVGDGVNDAPALAFATLGIAMGKCGAGAAVEAADMVLMRDDLALLPLAIRLGRLVLRKISQNLALAIGSKVVVTVAAVYGYTWLWLAILADVGAMVVVSLNGASILTARLPGYLEAEPGQNEAPVSARDWSESEAALEVAGAGVAGVACDEAVAWRAAVLRWSEEQRRRAADATEAMCCLCLSPLPCLCPAPTVPAPRASASSGPRTPSAWSTSPLVPLLPPSPRKSLPASPSNTATKAANAAGGGGEGHTQACSNAGVGGEIDFLQLVVQQGESARVECRAERTTGGVSPRANVGAVEAGAETTLPPPCPPVTSTGGANRGEMQRQHCHGALSPAFPGRSFLSPCLRCL